MTAEALERPYTLRSIQQMLGVSRGVVGGFIEAGFITPARGPRKEFRFSFQDVVLLRTACSLQAAQVPAARILRSLRSLRDRLPTRLPLSGLRLTAIGNDIAVRDDTHPLATASGQLLFDFEADAAPVTRPVAFLQRVPVAADAAPDEAARWFAQAEALEATDKAEAEAAYRRSLALRSDHGDAWLNLGALLCEAGRCDEAVALYGEALALFPGEALLHFNQAIALEDLGRQAEAIAGYERSIGLDPSMADAHYNAARLHQQLGHAQKAVRHFSAYRRLLK